MADNSNRRGLRQHFRGCTSVEDISYTLVQQIRETDLFLGDWPAHEVEDERFIDITQILDLEARISAALGFDKNPSDILRRYWEHPPFLLNGFTTGNGFKNPTFVVQVTSVPYFGKIHIGNPDITAAEQASLEAGYNYYFDQEGFIDDFISFIAGTDILQTFDIKGGVISLQHYLIDDSEVFEPPPGVSELEYWAVGYCKIAIRGPELFCKIPTPRPRRIDFAQIQEEVYSIERVKLNGYKSRYEEGLDLLGGPYCIHTDLTCKNRHHGHISDLEELRNGRYILGLPLLLTGFEADREWINYFVSWSVSQANRAIDRANLCVPHVILKDELEAFWPVAIVQLLKELSGCDRRLRTDLAPQQRACYTSSRRLILRFLDIVDS